MPLTFLLAEMGSSAGRPLTPIPGQERDTTGGPGRLTEWRAKAGLALRGLLLVMQSRVNVDEHHLPLADGAVGSPCLSACPSTPNG